jgi:diguanylate cyclase (GGDEF)-like protein
MTKAPLSPVVALILAVLAAGFLGVTDYLTGREMDLSFLYLVPITAVTLAAGRGAGMATSILSAGAWLWADLAGGQQYSMWLYPAWNAVVRGVYFVVHTLLLSRLTSALQREKEISGSDALTNALNWRRFTEVARLELDRSRRSRRPFTVAYIDLDNFKQVNDTQGHESGDDLLRILSDGIQGGVRSADCLGRVGGDEFTLLLPETGYEQAHAVLERVRSGVVADLQRGGWPVTLSVGAITFSVAPSSFESMIKRADDLMYTVKKSGKNAMRHIEWPGAEGPEAADEHEAAAIESHDPAMP